MKIVLTNDGSRTLYSESADQCFHSESGALSESQTVYLQNSGVLHRLKNGQPTRVLEIGLGTGFNFLLTADLAIEFETRLDYVGIDLGIPASKQLRELCFESFIRDQGLPGTWYQIADSNEPVNLHQLSPHVVLTTVLEPAETAILDTERFPIRSFDSVYMDAFSPNRSPELWEPEFLQQLGRLLKPNGTLTTYCVKSVIQKRVTEAGFQVQCLPGPEGGKRQVLLATRIESFES